MGLSLDAEVVYGIILEDSDFEDFDTLSELEDVDEDCYAYRSGLLEAIWDEDVGYTFFGYSEDPIYALVIQESRTSSFYQPVKLNTLFVSSSWNTKLEEACKRAGIKYREPYWILGGSYG